MSLKARIRNYAQANHIAAQVVLQNYMFERFLARLSQSAYKEKFVIKGGMLIAAILGLDIRSTMDLDTTLRGLPLTKETILDAVSAVYKIDLGDDTSFETISISPIRKDDIYGGNCVRINATYDTIVTPLSIDVSTGDVIIPEAILYQFSGIFDKSIQFGVWGYNIETVLAEKLETILNRGTFNTRPRDYYDTYILSTKQTFDRRLFEEALSATSHHRGSAEIIANLAAIIENISESDNLQNTWLKYQRKYTYARGIGFEDIMSALRELTL